MASGKSRNRKKNQPSKNGCFSFSTLLSLALALSVFGYYAYILGSGATRQKALASSSTTTTAVVIAKKNYFGNSPVSRQFSYSYSFKVDGKIYTGNSRDPAYKIGDSLKIKYVLSKPEYNEAIE